jgi:hypothetical protein
MQLHAVISNLRRSSRTPDRVHQDAPHAQTVCWLNAIITLVFTVNCVYLFWQHAGCILAGSYDSGWIIKTGEYILQQRQLPAHDIFSWTSLDRRFVCYQWLFEVIVASLFQIGGLWLVGLIACLTTGVLYFAVLPASWMTQRIPPLVTLSCLSLVLTPHWFNVRPQLCSYILILIFIHLLERYRKGNRSSFILALPALLVLWVNLHSFWFIGLMLIASYFLFDNLRRLRSGQGVNLELGLVLVSCIVASLVNPYGTDLFRYILSFTDSSQWMGMWEVQPSWLMPSAVLPLTYLVLAWVVLIRCRRHVPAEALMITLLAIIAALFVRRYLSVAVFCTWPYLGAALSTIAWGQYLPFRISGPLRRSKAVRTHVCTTSTMLSLAASSILISSAIWSFACPTEGAALSQYSDSTLEVLSFCSSHLKATDRVFNDPVTGSMMIFFGGPAVFLDTRYDMYRKDFCNEVMDCLTPSLNWTLILKKNSITHILVRNDYYSFNQALKESPEWLLAVDDGRLSLWLANRESQTEQLNKWRLSDDQISRSGLSPDLIARTIQGRCRKHYALAKKLLREACPSEAAGELEKAVKLLPTSKILRTEFENALAKSKTTVL